MHCKRLVSLGKSLSMQCIAKKTCKHWVRTLRKKGAQFRQKEEEEEEEEEFYRGVEVWRWEGQLPCCWALFRSSSQNLSFPASLYKNRGEAARQQEVADGEEKALIFHSIISTHFTRCLPKQSLPLCLCVCLWSCCCCSQQATKSVQEREGAKEVKWSEGKWARQLLLCVCVCVSLSLSLSIGPLLVPTLSVHCALF